MTTTHKFLPHVSHLKQCFVAGGAITSTYTNKPVADIDIYPKSWRALEDAIQWAFDAGLWCAHASNRALTFASKDGDPNVQIMTFDEFPTADSIFSAFDFTVCMGAYDLDEGKFVLHDKFLEHCAQRFLCFNTGTRFPYASAWRVRKYEEKGFTIGKMEFHKILMACAEKPIRSWGELKEQVGGVYGEAFDVPDNEPFSIEAAHKAMATVRPASPTNPFGSAEEAIVASLPIEREYFEVKDEQGKPVYFVRIGDEFERMKIAPKLGKPVAPFGGGVFYKKVVRDGGVLRSNHKPSFTYPVGEVVTSEAPYLWVVQTAQEARNYKLWSSKQEAVIEIHAEPEDIVCDHANVKIKRGRVIRVVDGAVNDNSPDFVSAAA